MAKSVLQFWSQTVVGSGKVDKNYLNAEIKKLVLSESEKTRKLIAKILSDSDSNKLNSNKILKLQPRQYQPNYGGNQGPISAKLFGRNFLLQIFTTIFLCRRSAM